MVTDNVDLDIDGIAGEGERAIAAAASTDALTDVESELLGKRSVLTRAHRTLGALSPEARKEAGRRLNEVRARLEAQRGRPPGRTGRGRTGRGACAPTAST